MKTFLEILLAHISTMLREIFFTFELWPPLSEGHLHCKLGAIWTRHCGATYV